MLFIIIGTVIGLCIGFYATYKYEESNFYCAHIALIGFLIGFVISYVVGVIISLSNSNSKTYEEYKLCPLYSSDMDDEIYLSSTVINKKDAYKYMIQSIEGNHIETETIDYIRITYIAEDNVPTVKIYNKPAEAKDWYILFGFPLYSIKSKNYYMEFFIPQNAIKE